MNGSGWTRQQQGHSPRRINFEVAVLRMVLRYFGLWDSAKGRLRMLREPKDVGKAISGDDEHRILDAIQGSRTPTLLPLFILSVDTGLRANELRHLRRRDVSLVWRDGTIQEGWITVAKSKTEGGTGRTIPVSRRGCAVLTLSLARFPNARPDSFVFPRHRIGFSGNRRADLFYDVDLNREIGSWKKAWRQALAVANNRAAEEWGKNRVGEKPDRIHYRWHDCRHTFISRLAENPAVSEQTLMALAGHVSKAMLARYSHIRSAAKAAAIAALEEAQTIPDGAQNWAQSEATENPDLPN